MVSAVAQNGRGEFFAAVHRVMQREGELPLANVFLNPVDVVELQEAGEIVDCPVPDGLILGSKQSRLTTIGNLLAVHLGVQPLYFITLGGIVFLELLHILGGKLGVFVRSAAQLDGIGPGFLGDGAILCQLQKVIGIGNIIQIPILLPFAVHIGFLRVKRLFTEQRV